MSDLSTFAPLGDLVGKRIADIEGTVIGHVSEFLIDSANGRIAYVQIRLVDDVAPEEQQLVVPWSSIRTATPGRSGWQLPIGKSALDSLVKSRLN